MSIISWVHEVEEDLTQVFLTRPLTSEEQAEAERIIGDTIGPDGDNYPIGHPEYKEWINIGTLTPELEAYLTSLS